MMKLCKVVGQVAPYFPSCTAAPNVHLPYLMDNSSANRNPSRVVQVQLRKDFATKLMGVTKVKNVARIPTQMVSFAV
jgi:hypothetical protein